MVRDIKIKRASYIDKNCKLLQEFMFAQPSSRLQANQIFNSHFTGSPIWDLFSEEAKMLENTWNTSFRRMFDLPYQTHRYLVEPVSGQLHLKKLLIKRFLSFLKQIRKSSKILPAQLLNIIQFDTRSVTGRNINRILLLTRKSKLEDVTKEDIENIEYAEISDENIWRVNLIKEITNKKFNQLEINGFSEDECEEILQYACVS